jgi:hypothetical protein
MRRNLLALILLSFTFVLSTQAEPRMSVSVDYHVGYTDYDILNSGLETLFSISVANVSSESIQDNNLIQMVFPAGYRQGVFHANEMDNGWDVEILDDCTVFAGNGEFVAVGGNVLFYLYSSQTNGVTTGLATAVAAGDSAGTLDFNAVEVPVPLCLPVCFVPPANLTNAVKTVAGAEHFLALTSDGTIVAWGDTRDGACDVPDGLSNLVDIAAGRTHSAALLSDGSVVCWGRGAQEVPLSVFGAKAIAARENHTIAMMRGTNPTLPDTDFDGANDGVEVTVGTDPLDASQRAMNLTASASAHGSVSPTNQWVFPGSQLSVTASPETYYQVGQWTGSTNAIASSNGNVVNVLMTNDVSLSAIFVQVVTENGDVPHQWLAGQGFDIGVNDPEAIVATDHDNDGYTTAQEYILGTSPTNSTSTFVVDPSPSSESGFRIQFPTVTGRLYSVEYSTNLISNVWNPLTNNISGSENLIEITDENIEDGRFYRINVRLENE